MTRTLLLLTAAVAACGEALPPERPAAYEYIIRLQDGFPLVFHWTPVSLPVRVYAPRESDLRHHAAEAIRLWESNALYGEFTAVLVADSTRADVMVRLGEGEIFNRVEGTATLADCRGATSIAVERDTTIALPFNIFLSPRRGAPPDNVQRCLGIVLAHELGHALGLFLHSTDPMDLMYRQPQALELSARDRATFSELYHSRATVGVPGER